MVVDGGVPVAVLPAALPWIVLPVKVALTRHSSLPPPRQMAVIGAVLPQAALPWTVLPSNAIVAVRDAEIRNGVEPATVAGSGRSGGVLQQAVARERRVGVAEEDAAAAAPATRLARLPCTVLFVSVSSLPSALIPPP